MSFGGMEERKTFIKVQNFLSSHKQFSFFDLNMKIFLCVCVFMDTQYIFFVFYVYVCFRHMGQTQNIMTIDKYTYILTF